MIYAAIDIGSNATRLLIANVFRGNKMIKVEKSTLVRVPTRLGMDVYTQHKISKKRIKMLLKTLKAYKLIMEVYKPVAYDICATAAMREAANGPEIIQLVKDKLGMDIRIIDGKEEADIIRHTNKMDIAENNYPYLFVDVGGGSTDVSLLKDNELIEAKSFKIGTLRMLAGKVKSSEWKKLRDWLRHYKAKYGNFTLIASGGNINKINKMYGDPVNFVLTREQLKHAYEDLSRYSLEERIEKLGLRPDRADVIIPAAKIFLFILDELQLSQIYVPKIGLVDGLVYMLYEKGAGLEKQKARTGG